MTDHPTTPPLRLVTDQAERAEQSDPAIPHDVGGDGAVPDQDPLAKLVQRIEDLPLRERPAAFERLNANLVAELNALEEV